jgi:hypothetical protein
VSSEELELGVTQLVFRFRPHQVRAIEVLRVVPLIGKGIRIHHDIAGYPQLIVFWTMGNPSALAAELREYGFGNDPSRTYEPTEFPAERSAFQMMGVMWIVFAVFFVVIFVLPVLLCLGCSGLGLFSGGGGSSTETSSPLKQTAPASKPGPAEGIPGGERQGTERHD